MVKTANNEEAKCTNYKLCNNVVCVNSLCQTCDEGNFGVGWKELEFRESHDECIMCNQITDTQLKFPTNCGHWFCIFCSRRILFWDETQYYVSPISFGSPSCPNECVNPIRGQQCGCAEYAEVLKKWEHDWPEQHAKWADAQDMSIESGSFQQSVLGSKTCQTCPLCINNLL